LLSKLCFDTPNGRIGSIYIVTHHHIFKWLFFCIQGYKKTTKKRAAATVLFSGEPGAIAKQTHSVSLSLY